MIPLELFIWHSGGKKLCRVHVTFERPSWITGASTIARDKRLNFFILQRWPVDHSMRHCVIQLLFISKHVPPPFRKQIYENLQIFPRPTLYPIIDSRYSVLRAHVSRSYSPLSILPSVLVSVLSVTLILSSFSAISNFSDIVRGFVQPAR